MDKELIELLKSLDVSENEISTIVKGLEEKEEPKEAEKEPNGDEEEDEEMLEKSKAELTSKMAELDEKLAKRKAKKVEPKMAEEMKKSEENEILKSLQLEVESLKEEKSSIEKSIADLVESNHQLSTVVTALAREMKLIGNESPSFKAPRNLKVIEKAMDTDKSESTLSVRKNKSEVISLIEKSMNEVGFESPDYEHLENSLSNVLAEGDVTPSGKRFFASKGVIIS